VDDDKTGRNKRRWSAPDPEPNIWRKKIKSLCLCFIIIIRSCLPGSRFCTTRICDHGLNTISIYIYIYIY
jgi:hypothetical protein